MVPSVWSHPQYESALGAGGWSFDIRCYSCGGRAGRHYENTCPPVSEIVTDPKSNQYDPTDPNGTLNAAARPYRLDLPPVRTSRGGVGGVVGEIKAKVEKPRTHWKHARYKHNYLDVPDNKVCENCGATALDHTRENISGQFAVHRGREIWDLCPYPEGDVPDDRGNGNGED